MDSQGNPLLIPELVDYFITYLRNSPSDLRACALVSRSWIYAAQSHLFRSGSQERHIRRLELSSIRLSRETFSAACNFPFTRLEVVMIFLFEDADFIDIQQLFSLPTLRRLDIEPQLIDSVTFTQIWDRISPSIRHLRWYFMSHNVHPVVHRSTSIILDSLSLRILGSAHLSSLFQTYLQYLFDFPRLRALSLCWISAPLLIQLAPTLRSLEVLDFAPPDGSMSVDLSHSAKLEFLRISAASASMIPAVVATLSTITPNRLRSIVVQCFELDEAKCVQLDAALSHLASSLQTYCSVVLSIHPERYDYWVSHFTKSSSKITIRRSYLDANWFQRIIDKMRS